MKHHRVMHLALIVLVLAVLMARPAYAQDNTRIHDIVDQFVDGVFNQGDIDLIDELFREDFVSHTISANEHESGREELRDTVVFFRRAIPDLTASSDFVVVEGNTASFLLQLDGTFAHDIADTGSHRVVRATHDPVHFTFMIVMRFDENDRITDDWVLNDSVSYFAQFGMTDAVEFFRDVSGG